MTSNSEPPAGRALIVGGGTGLGLGAAEALARRGFGCFITGRRADVLERAARGIGAGWLAGDGTDAASAWRVADAAVAAMGGLDTLVVSAGMSAIGSIATETEADFLRVLHTNLLPSFHFTQAALPHMEAGGAIIAIASVVASVPHAERVAYCTSKSALVGMVRQMALDLAPRKIRVNAVSPSLVLTELTQGIMARETDPAAALSARQRQHPIGRLGTAAEVGEAVAWLASPAGAWVTGQDIVLDGGLSLMAARRDIKEE
ncbi:MAG: SDR family oxidoreductase [Acetobacteraceae bacterium]|nr:SDR family oxidoreductase [Acetobacteraceae bacterium]